MGSIEIIEHIDGNRTDRSPGHVQFAVRHDGWSREHTCLSAQADDMEAKLVQALEENLDSPFLRNLRFPRAAEALRAQGEALAQLLAETEFPVHEGPLEGIKVFGSNKLFSQAWETICRGEEEPPWSLRTPVLRIVPGTAPYQDINPRHERLNILVLSARENWRSDIPPRLITLLLRQMKREGEMIGLGVIAPTYPSEIEGSLTRRSCLAPEESLSNILHIDAHGMLLTYEELVTGYGAIRAPFEAHSWGQEILPYKGLKAFVAINGADEDGSPKVLPASGDEIGALCRGYGIEAVVLNACQAATNEASGGIATDLIRSGVPDVVAFRHVVTAAGAAIFVPALYRALAQGLSIAQACCRGRAALYEQRWRRIGGDLVLFPDWASVVHYTSRAGEPVARSGDPAPEGPLAVEGELPVWHEWSLLHLQDLIFRRRVTPLAPANLGGAPARAIALMGPLGTGAEALMMEALAWLAETDLSVSGSVLLDVTYGVDPGLEVYFGCDTTSWSSTEMTERILDRWGENTAFGFLGLDYAIDSQHITREELVRANALIQDLAQRGVVVLTKTSRDLRYEDNLDLLGISAYAQYVGAVPFDQAEDWLRSTVPRPEDEIDSVVIRLLSWTAGPFFDLFQLARSCDTAQERELFLDYLVTGRRNAFTENPEFKDLVRHVQARWKFAFQEKNLTPLIVPLGGLASNVLLEDIGRVGNDVGDAKFPSVPRRSFDEVKKPLAYLVKHHLASVPTDSYLAPATSKDFPDQALLRSHPLLRPLTREMLVPEILDGLDAWTVAFAAERIHAYTSLFLQRWDDEKLATLLKHAKPLIGVALWLARKDSTREATLRGAIRSAKLAGWWPKDIDLLVLFEGAEEEETTIDPKSLYAAMNRAHELQRRGLFHESLAVLEGILSAIGDNRDDFLFTEAYYDLGTVLIDLHEYEAAGKALSKAEDNGTYHFVSPQRQVHLDYEQGQVARELGRWAEAERRYKAAIQGARALDLPQLECLCFQELANHEISSIPIVLGPTQEIEEGLKVFSEEVAQARLYLDAAWAAQEHLKPPRDERGALTYMEARLEAALGHAQDAKKIALEALEISRDLGDQRAGAIESFLWILSLNERVQS